MTERVGTKRLRLRRSDTCVACGTTLPAGVEADWSSEARTVTCLPCADGLVIDDSGAAGASAKATADRHRAERAAQEQRIKTAHPILGRIVLAVEPLKDEGASWAKGFVGESKLGGALDGMADAGVLVLHDRRRPRTTANIDHLAITPTGVWVIDAKRYGGKVERARRGLVVPGRDRTKLVDGVRRQVADVKTALASAHLDVPVRGALCFVDSEWGLFARPFSVDGVVVSWGKALRQRLAEPGSITGPERIAIQRALHLTFPPAKR